MVYIILFFLAIFNLSFSQENFPIIKALQIKEYLNDKNTVFINVEDYENYKAYHIKNSVNIDVLAVQDIAIKNNEKQKCNYLPLCPKTAEKIFSEKGISNDSRIIIYYNSNLPNKASYMWFLLYSMGHNKDKIFILDKDWKNENLPVESGEEYKVKPTKYKAKPRYDVVATKEEVLKHVQNYNKGIEDNTLLIDTRTFLEFTGRQEMNEIKRSGHIPGAKFVYWRWFEGKESLYKPYEKLSEDIKKLNLDLSKKIILYCTIGNRSSFVFIPLHYLGAKNLKIYTGSWYEWGNDESLPIEKEKYKN